MLIRVSLLLIFFTCSSYANTLVLAKNRLKKIETNLSSALDYCSAKDFDKASWLVLSAAEELILFEMEFGFRPAERKLEANIKDSSLWLAGYFWGPSAPKNIHKKMQTLHILNEPAFFILEMCGKSDIVEKELNDATPNFQVTRKNYKILETALRVKSSMYQRLGHYERALKAIDKAVKVIGFSNTKVRHDFLYLRQGYLLRRTGRFIEANTVLQRVIDLYPKSRYKRYAKKLLVDVKAYSPANSTRICKHLNGKYWVEAISSLHHHQFKSSLPILLRQGKKSDHCMRNRYIKAFGHLGDKRAIPYLESCIKSGTIVNITNAALALVRLGEIQYLPHYLVIWSRDVKNDYHSQAYLQMTLLRAMPEGPKFAERKSPTRMAFSKEWTNHVSNQILKGRRQQTDELPKHEPIPYRKPVIPLQVIAKYCEQNSVADLGVFSEEITFE